MQYASTFVRYESRGGRKVPVRVTKQWVTFESRGGKTTRRFITTSVTELKYRDIRAGLDRTYVHEGQHENWVSNTRQDTRERLLGMVVRYSLPEGGLPVLEDPTAGPFLPLDDASGWTLRQAQQPMDAEPDSCEWNMRRQWAELRGFDDEPEVAQA